MHSICKSAKDMEGREGAQFCRTLWCLLPAFPEEIQLGRWEEGLSYPIPPSRDS